MDPLTVVLAALFVYRVLVIPTVRGTLGIWIDVLDIRERRRRLRASTPPLPQSGSAQRLPTASQPVRDSIPPL